MSLGKRLTKLEIATSSADVDDAPLVVLGRDDLSEASVIGLFTCSPHDMIARLAGETMAALVARARPLLGSPSAGMPRIVCCAYAEGDIATAT